MINELRYLNYFFLRNHKNGFKIDNKNYIYRVGKNPIVLSAPHAVKQQRPYKDKLSDYLTGPLAIYLAEKCDCSYFVRIFNDNDDPNWPLEETLNTIENEYLKALINFIKVYQQSLVIDIHGCKNKRLYDISMFTDNYKTCHQRIVNIFAKELRQNNLSVDDTGSEYLSGQVTRQCSLVTNAIQMEIKRKCRSLKEEDLIYLSAFIDSMEEAIKETSYTLKKINKY